MDKEQLRIAWIDVMKGFLFTLVVLGHFIYSLCCLFTLLSFSSIWKQISLVFPFFSRDIYFNKLYNFSK